MPLLTRDIEPLWIARYDYEPQWHLPPHAHDDYFQIILIVSGTGEAIIGAERRPFGAGQMLFLRPRLVHSLTAWPLLERTLSDAVRPTSLTAARRSIGRNRRPRAQNSQSAASGDHD